MFYTLYSLFDQNSQCQAESFNYGMNSINNLIERDENGMVPKHSH